MGVTLLAEHQPLVLSIEPSIRNDLGAWCVWVCGEGRFKLDDHTLL